MKKVERREVLHLVFRELRLVNAYKQIRNIYKDAKGEFIHTMHNKRRVIRSKEGLPIVAQNCWRMPPERTAMDLMSTFDVVGD